MKSTFDNSDQWLDGLTQSCALDGKTYCVPYYGGDRAVTYRKDIFADAGITTPPASWDELLTDIQKISDKHQSDKNFSAFYMPGLVPVRRPAVRLRHRRHDRHQQRRQVDREPELAAGAGRAWPTGRSSSTPATTATGRSPT